MKVMFKQVQGMLHPFMEGHCLAGAQPEKEAKEFALHNRIIEGEVCVLGLGLGAHINELANSKDFKAIWVIERIEGLVGIFFNQFPHLRGKVHILQIDTLEALYNHEILKHVAQRGLTVLPFRPAWVGSEREYEEYFSALTGRSKRGLEFALKVHGWDLPVEEVIEDGRRLLSIKDLHFVVDATQSSRSEYNAIRILRELVQ